MDMTWLASLLGDFHFLRPWWLLAALPAALFLAALWRLDSAASAWVRAIDPQLLPWLLQRDSTVTSRWPLLLLLAAWLLSIIALAGPVWRQLPQPVQQRDDELVIVLDLSLSMFAPDHQPARIDLAKRKLWDILNLRQEGQTALVVYAGDAYTVTPLTDDTATIAAMVPSLNPNIMPLFGSNPAAAISRAITLLDDGEATRGKILLMTDGISGAAQEREIAELVSPTNYQLLVMGIGTEAGAPIRTNEGGYLTDERGQMIVPKLDRSLLLSLANRVGGRYHDIQLSDSDIEYLLADFTAAGDRQLSEAEEEFDVWYETGPWLLLLVVPLCALSFRRGWLLAVALAGGLSLLVPSPPAAAQNQGLLLPDGAEMVAEPSAESQPPPWGWRDLWRSRDQQGAAAFAAEDHATAATLFEEPDWRGAAAYRAGRYDTAAGSFGLTDSATGNYNRGTALAQAGDYAGALAAYDRTLELEPEHADARHNRDIVEQLLEQQQQQQQQESEQETGEDGENQEGESESQETEGEESQQQQGEEQQEQSGEAEDQEGEEGEEGEQQEQQGETAEDQQASEVGEEQDGSPSDASNEAFETQQALEQWLRRIQDDPGELLRRKFRYEYRQRQLDGTAGSPPPGGQIW